MDTIFCTCPRAARAHLSTLDLHCFKLTLRLPYGSDRVFDCLRDLSCLVHWWPHAQSIQPLPPGLCNIGDQAILQLRQGTAQLRVLAFKPAKRMVLAIALPQRLVLLDLSVLRGENGCELEFRLETPHSPELMAGLREWLWLRTLGAGAAAALEKHLRDSDRMLASTPAYASLPI